MPSLAARHLRRSAWDAQEARSSCNDHSPPDPVHRCPQCRTRVEAGEGYCSEACEAESAAEFRGDEAGSIERDAEMGVGENNHRASVEADAAGRGTRYV